MLALVVALSRAASAITLGSYFSGKIFPTHSAHQRIFPHALRNPFWKQESEELAVVWRRAKTAHCVPHLALAAAVGDAYGWNDAVARRA